MFKKEYEPNHRGYDVHHGYYQGPEPRAGRTADRMHGMRLEYNQKS